MADKVNEKFRELILSSSNAITNGIFLELFVLKEKQSSKEEFSGPGFKSYRFKSCLLWKIGFRVIFRVIFRVMDISDLSGQARL